MTSPMPAPDAPPPAPAATLPTAVDDALSVYERTVFRHGVLAHTGELTDDDCAREDGERSALRHAIADALTAARAATLAEVDRAAVRIVTGEIPDPDDGMYWQPFAVEWSDGDPDAGHPPCWTWYVADDEPGDPSLCGAILAAAGPAPQ